jgi:hypothetical protein
LGHPLGTGTAHGEIDPLSIGGGRATPPRA